jgi:outer membrane protein OmpA-like peptidoglycan-associated protein/opacity protein-like surface antigen
MKQVRLLFLVMALPILAMAQQKWGGGLFLGYSNYLGDLVEPDFTMFGQAGPAFGINIRNQVKPSFAILGNLNYGKLQGDDANYDRNRERGASFSKSLIEFSVTGEYDIFGKRRYNGSTFTKTLSPYILAGIGVGFGDPKTENGEAEIKKGNLAIPFGLGLRYDLNSKVFLALEYSSRLTFSDDIDGVSSTSGNPGDNDFYNFGGLKVGFMFGDKDSDDDGVVDEEDSCPTIAGSATLAGCPDTDGDGIADKDDTCPNEGGEQRMNGCPDRDGDGVADNADDCPDEAGLRRFAGCPDTDGDNIIDKEDNCPTVVGIAAMNGCPDSDRDGITDDKDACPNDPGPAEQNGCPDTDNDGIADNVDECPKEPGVKKFNGCADTDNDNVSDNKDKCPNLAGPIANEGCPEIKAEDKAVLDLAMKNVQFETSQAKLLPSSLKVLDQIAEVMKRYPGYGLTIDGYTDSQGNDFANQQLSENRAKACFEYLAGKGVSKELMTHAGHGESDPIGDNNTSEGRRKNRRVIFTLVNPK